MKELLYGWIQDIAFYSLLMVVVQHILPEKNQKKYLQFFMGMVMIIVVLAPALQFTGLDQKLDEAYAKQTYDQELQDFLVRQEKLEDDYRKKIEESISRAEQEAEEGEKRKGREQEGEDIGIPEIRIEIKTME